MQYQLQCRAFTYWHNELAVLKEVSVFLSINDTPSLGTRSKLFYVLTFDLKQVFMPNHLWVIDNRELKSSKCLSSMFAKKAPTNNVM